MDASFVQAFQAAKNPEDKAALIAEVSLGMFSDETAHVARQCVLFHWFDQSVVEALLQAVPSDTESAQDVYRQITSLPFIEQLSWGVAYQELTRQGLLKYYAHTQPELLKNAARVAAPLYRASTDNDRNATEALFCSIISGDASTSALHLNTLLEQAMSRQDWSRMENLFHLQEEAEQLSFVEPIPSTEQYWMLRSIIDRMQGKLDAALSDYDRALTINPKNALAYLNRSIVHRQQKNYRQALADYNEALRLDPALVQTYADNRVLSSMRQDTNTDLRSSTSASGSDHMKSASVDASESKGRTFAQILSSERERRFWTQADVAERLDTLLVNVSRWERGVSIPGPYHRQKLCDIFGLGFDEFSFVDQSHASLEGLEKELPVENPSTFHFNEPLLDPKEFYGRSREWVTLRSRLLRRSSTSIVGPRRIGKSWLLTYVKFVMRDFSERIHICYFDARRPSCNSVEAFLRTVLTELNIPLSQVSLASSLVMLEYLERIVYHKRDQQQIVVLCIDEFEGLCTMPDFQFSFLEGLRALTQIGLVLITASERSLVDIVSEALGEQGKTSPFFNIFQQLRLKPFNEYEAQKFVKEKGIQAGFLQQEREILLRYGQMSAQQWPPPRLQLVGKMLEEAKYLALYEDASYYRPDEAGYWVEFEQRLEETYRGVGL